MFLTLKIKFTVVFTYACYWKSDAKYKRCKASNQMFTCEQAVRDHRLYVLVYF